MDFLDPEREAVRIREVFGAEGVTKVWDLLDRQFATLHSRAQVLLGLAGIVITTTGFSGRVIAGTSALAQGLIVGGVSIALAAAGLLVWGVLPIRWITQFPGEPPDAWLRGALAYRDRKTRLYRVSQVLLAVGLALYVAAIAAMLLNPNAGALPAR
ncbi:MAG: hypothetical protein M5U26_09235 [Planctomycetota bacterium]|nr:hypothetical protein [Planctomycetota bacterium]